MFIIDRLGHESALSVLRFHHIYIYISMLIIKVLISLCFEFKCVWQSHVLSTIVVTFYNYVILL